MGDEDSQDGRSDGVVGTSASGKPVGMGFAMAAARRKAIRQAMHPLPIKHGLIKQPHIAHTQDGAGTSPPKFGVGGGFKAGGF